MLAFYAVRGADLEKIMKGTALERRFYYHAMELYYMEKAREAGYKWEKR